MFDFRLEKSNTLSWANICVGVTAHLSETMDTRQKRFLFNQPIWIVRWWAHNQIWPECFHRLKIKFGMRISTGNRFRCIRLQLQTIIFWPHRSNAIVLIIWCRATWIRRITSDYSKSIDHFSIIWKFIRAKRWQHSRIYYFCTIHLLWSVWKANGKYNQNQWFVCSLIKVLTYLLFMDAGCQNGHCKFCSQTEILKCSHEVFINSLRQRPKWKKSSLDIYWKKF